MSDHDKDDDLLRQCYRSGQMSERQWQQHRAERPLDLTGLAMSCTPWAAVEHSLRQLESAWRALLWGPRK